PDSAKKQSLLKFDAILGLGIREVKPLNIPPAVTELITKREEARQAKEWAKADEFRGLIKSHGFTVDDTDLGPVVKPVR
ncbi:MAG: cysteine--tRNA ligase, partial [Candidatus Kerfeldbacteria bacterium]|nr:cysteine--tRNA ligase [Candidatus Kerfeldbacteria bacterium]